MNLGGLLSFLSPALTTAAEAEGTYQNADLQSKLRQRQQDIQALLMQRQLRLQDAEMQHLGAETNELGARSTYYTARTPNQNALRTALINAGNDPDDVDAVLASGNYGALRDMLKPAAAPKPPSRTQGLQARITELMGKGMSAEEANAAARTEFGYVMPRTSSVGPRAIPETPDHRNARQAAATTMNALRDTRSQMAPLQKQLGNALTPDDSSAVQSQLAPLEQRADSLRGAYDRQAQLMNIVLPGSQGSATTPAPSPNGMAPNSMLDSVFGAAGARRAAGVTRTPAKAPGGSPTMTPPADDVQAQLQHAQDQLGSILSNPNVPDEVKAQARAAYAQRAQRLTGAMPAGTP